MNRRGFLRLLGILPLAGASGATRMPSLVSSLEEFESALPNQGDYGGATRALAPVASLEEFESALPKHGDYDWDEKLNNALRMLAQRIYGA